MCVCVCSIGVCVCVCRIGICWPLTHTLTCAPPNSNPLKPQPLITTPPVSMSDSDLLERSRADVIAIRRGTLPAGHRKKNARPTPLPLNVGAQTPSLSPSIPPPPSSAILHTPPFSVFIYLTPGVPERRPWTWSNNSTLPCEKVARLLTRWLALACYHTAKKKKNPTQPTLMKATQTCRARSQLCAREERIK